MPYPFTTLPQLPLLSITLVRNWKRSLKLFRQVLLFNLKNSEWSRIRITLMTTPGVFRENSMKSVIRLNSIADPTVSLLSLTTPLLQARFCLCHKGNY
ncbi:hypothetical protein TNCT_237491 [Trichonephila clavata]|uniref:Uncharacterized protein n=1 Tax=Trichonephila clavata TaxID=2740835 RepID=A0A8X6KUD6_TRICU|nr:hypothetical protein TNCT_237491 [Trichonephila clavata]